MKDSSRPPFNLSRRRCRPRRDSTRTTASPVDDQPARRVVVPSRSRRRVLRGDVSSVAIPSSCVPRDVDDRAADRREKPFFPKRLIIFPAVDARKQRRGTFDIIYYINNIKRNNDKNDGMTRFSRAHDLVTASSNRGKGFWRVFARFPAVAGGGAPRREIYQYEKQMKKKKKK